MYYFDNAATTVQKPECVAQAVYEALHCGLYGNPSRGAHAYSLRAYEKVLEAKELVKKLFHAGSEYDVAFTHNSTVALNMVLKGLFQRGDHILTTTWEHNAVLRPLYQLEKEGVTLDFIASEPVTGALRYEEFEKKIRPHTKAVVCNHASNVTGNVLDLAYIKKVCQRRGLQLIVDVSQTAGAYPIDLADGIVTAVCFTGHKSLYGPGGTGGICMRKDVVVTPYITGGDGVHSFAQEQPANVPDVFTAGTANVAGIIGLAASVKKLVSGGLENAIQHQEQVAAYFIPALHRIAHVQVYGDFLGPRVGVYSLNIGNADSAVVSNLLWDTYQMATRPAFHCAPLMHEALGTARQGTVRFSFSQFTTIEEVKDAVQALEEIAKNA